VILIAGWGNLSSNAVTLRFIVVRLTLIKK
jgi:hypothetical protein